MSRRIDAMTSRTKCDRRDSLSPGVLSWLNGGRACSDDDILGEVSHLVETMNRDNQFREQAAEFKGTTLVLSATDTGRELAIILDGQGVRARPYAGGGFDVKIQATEKVHWSVLSGEMDADAAFFTGRVRICGSVIVAFRLKNRFLSLLQWHLTHGYQATEEIPLRSDRQKGERNG